MNKETWLKGYWDKFFSEAQKFFLYIKKHSLLVRYKERKKGISRTLFAWTLVGFTGISFSFALERTQIPGPIALFYQSCCILLFLFFKCLFNDGLSSLKVIEKVTFDPQHLSVSKRRWSIFARGTLGILAGAAFEYSKLFSTIVDNSTLFGADALVVALLMRIVLRERLGWRWAWIFIAFFGILTIFYTDFQAINPLISIRGALFGAFSTLCFAIVFLMTSYMVHHDKPITIAFYQGVAAVAYSFLYLAGSLIFLLINNDIDQIQNYFHFFKFENLMNMPIMLLCLGGMAYGWALPLFFESFYFTETLILASLGYFLGPILSIYELIFYGESKTTWINKWSILLVTIGTGGLLLYEKRAKKKNGLFVVPVEESPQESLYATVLDYKNGRVDVFYYLSHMYEFDRTLYLFSDLIRNSNIKEISIKREGVDFVVENPNIILRDDASIRCPTFDTINFGFYEPKIHDFLKSVLKDGDIIFDIGAGTGWYALTFASLYKTAKIFAFEPIRELFEILSENINTNDFKNIQSFNFSISNKSKTLLFHYVKNQHEYLRNILEPLEEKAEVRALEEILESLHLSKVDFIKQELKVKEQPFILGNEEQITKLFPMMMFSFREYWNEELIETFHQSISFLENLGYETITFDEELMQKKIKEKHCFYYHPKKHPRIMNIKNIRSEK
ncbi:MAG: FkbM family methyltransferase [Simkaniaceae bacterium]|nr:FkbM family methyltransferase [Candidatus Sacchlamyda saccharinae]